MKYKIADINQSYQNVDITAKILSVDKRVIQNEKGQNTYYYGLLGDETGTIPFTAWILQAGIKSGDVVEIKNGSSRIYNGNMRIYIDSHSQVILKPKEDIEVKRSSEFFKIRDIPPNVYYASVTGRISGVSEKRYIRDGEEHTVYQGYLEDETARIRISSFGKKLDDGSTVKIEGAKVSEFNGYLSLSLGDN
ncbi:MAG: replication factor A, partial [Thermoplasmata archaeon]